MQNNPSPTTRPSRCFGDGRRFGQAQVQRRGLAPLELVLWLPILLFVTALMVNLGTMTVWRIRGEIVARDAVWRIRYPRTGDTEPRPLEHVWPEGAAMDVVDAGQIGLLDDPETDHPVVRGPLDNGVGVNDTLQPDVGVRSGMSEIVRPMPLLPTLGDYQSGQILHPLMDETWRNARMGIPRVYRRGRILYELPQADASLPDAFSRAAESLFAIPNYEYLDVLDNDDEIIEYRGSPVDFHPTVPRPDGRDPGDLDGLRRPSRCQLDVDDVKERFVDTLVAVRNSQANADKSTVVGRPIHMTDYFIGMYRAEIADLEEQIENWEQLQEQGMGNYASEIAAAEAEIAELEEKVEQLETFKERLGEIDIDEELPGEDDGEDEDDDDDDDDD